LDTGNDSGGISSAAVNSLFTQMDSDGDGTVSTQETQDSVTSLLEQIRSQTAAARRDMPPPGMAPPPAEEFLSSADSNGDGALDATEFYAAMDRGEGTSANATSHVQSMFSDADSDGDGLLTTAELQDAADRNSPEGPRSGNGNRGEALSNLVSTWLKQYTTSGQTSSSTLSVLA
jgi:Ca2+-binding EF-hand superfamily protein